MRSLFINRMVFMERGGGETFDLEMARYLVTMGCQVQFLGGIPLFGRPPRVNGHIKTDPSLPSARGNYYLRSPYFGWFPWDVVRGGWRLRLFEFYMFEMAALKWAVRHQKEFDVVHVCELPNFVVGWKKKGIPIPVVMRLTAGNFVDPHGALQAADAVIASGMTVPQLREGPRTDVVDVSNAVDSERFRPHASGWKRDRGWTEDDFVLLYVARFQAFKNHALLIRAYRRFLDLWMPRNPEKRAWLVMAGSGPLLRRARQQGEELGVSDRMLFLEEVSFDEMPALYAAADIKVISSYFESFCFAALEAMATGLPIVTTDCGWVPRLLGQTKAVEGLEVLEGGWVVQQNDAETLAQALYLASENPAMRQSMGKRNRQTVIRDYNWAASASRLLGVYDSLVNTTRVKERSL
jgi:glycosyltransferase involved in cell wall biosynthesis